MRRSPCRGVRGLLATLPWVLLWPGLVFAFAQAATSPGSVTTPYPTTQAIAIEWAITGDSNNNGVVGVRYRKQGAVAWQTGMSLARVPAGANTSARSGRVRASGATSTLAACSTLRLAPATKSN